MPLQLWKPQFGCWTVGSPGKSKGNCLPEKEPRDFSTPENLRNFGHPKLSGLFVGDLSTPENPTYIPKMAIS